MSITTQSKGCPKCGGPIPAEAPQGLCPKCLLQQACVPTEAGRGESAKAAPPTHEQLAAAFPHLEILELIGQGGMGFVFKARQPKLDRFVALKILPQSLAADAAFAERFTREGRMLARLNHPNIVAIHDFGQAGGFFYLLMEFVDGVNLREAMKVGRFTPAQALSIVPKICEALQFAHNEGILHRDIKPENILLDTKGRVKIADFGIAKLLGEPHTDASLTASGAVLGTPHYMAPEQLEKSGEVDQRADIYSLGVVFYEMLTGELPLGRFQPPSEKVQVDVRLDEVVLHALEKEPARRYQQVSQVKTDVETISGSPAGPAAPIGTPPFVAAAAAPEQRPDRFWRWFAVVVLALIMIPVGIAVVGLLAAIAIPNFAKARNRARLQQSVAQPGKTVMLTGATNELLNATNNLRVVRVHTDSSLFPGETLVALNTLPDGRTVEDGSTSFFILRRASGVQTTSHFSWTLADSFSPEDFEFAATQLRQNTTGRPIELPQGKPVELFSVTNRFGGIVRGFLRFEHFVPGAASTSAGSGTNVEATVRLRSYGGGLLAFYTASVPRGYFLEAADNSSEFGEGEAFTSINNADRHSSWSAPRSFTFEQQREAVAQLQRLAEKGPLRVVYGEPRQVFSITNKAGEVYRGSFELVGPAAPAELPDHLPPTDGSAATVPGLAPSAPEAKFVIDTVQFDITAREPGRLDWGFKCFVPPGHLASILFVRWTNGVPQVDPAFSAYFKVGKAGGIDLPFCSLSCYPIPESQFSGLMNSNAEERRRLAQWGFSEAQSAGVTNAVQWSANLGLGFTSSAWRPMPPYHGLKLQLPQSIRSGHQRAIRLVDFDTPEGEATHGQSGVELRIFLEPLESPPIRMFPNEVDRTNYIGGTGLAGTMEDALSAIKQWPTDP